MTSATAGITAQSAATTTTLIVSPARGGAHDTFTFTATVTALAASAKPTGSVSFLELLPGTGPQNDEEWAEIADVPVDPKTGVAVWHGRGDKVVVPPQDGLYPHVVKAYYTGSADFSPSTSGTVTYLVNQGTGEYYLFPSVSPNPATADQPLTVEVWVYEGEDVTVCEGKTILGRGSLDADAPDWPSGTVSVLIPQLAVGTHGLTASLGGCPADPGVSTVATVVVVPARGSSTSPGGGNKLAAIGPHTATTSTSSAYPTTTTGPTLAQTGTAVGAELGAGSGALALGALLLLLTRRRGRSAH